MREGQRFFLSLPDLDRFQLKIIFSVEVAHLGATCSESLRIHKQGGRCGRSRVGEAGRRGSEVGEMREACRVGPLGFGWSPEGTESKRGYRKETKRGLYNF